ncbi:MAG: type I methionyl aminopeptidase [Phycisphaerales bacterium]
MSRVPILSERDAEAARNAAQRVVQVHRRLAEWLRPGLTLAEVDAFVASTLEDLRCRSCFLGYRVPRTPPFPSHACLSVNECIVHGTAGYTSEPLKDGDLLSVDIGVWYQGWVGDAAWTYAMRERTDEAARLMQAGRDSIAQGVQQLRPGNRLVAWAQTVQRIVETEAGFHLTRGLGGHGYGKALHGPPFVSNTVPSFGLLGEWPDAQLVLQPGMLMAVEPMIAVGTGQTRSEPRSWPVFSADGSLSVHYEHDVLIGNDGPIVLTEGLDDLPDIVG